MDVRVISNTTTFYPVEIDENSHGRNDNMSLRATLVYLREQMSEDFQFLTADDLFIVLQQWRGIVFFIQSRDSRFHDVMRLMLQTIREILVFLFGVKFEFVMGHSIVHTNRLIFAQYVDAYLANCQSDYLSLLGALRAEQSCPHVGEMFVEASTRFLPEFDLNLLSCFLFHDHQFVAKFIVPGAVKFEPETFSMLAIFEKVEYGQPAEELDEKFSSAYVISADNNTMKHKTAFLWIERTPVACTLSSTRCAFGSPFVILVVTQNVNMGKRKGEIQMKIVDFLTAITSRLTQLVVRPVPPPPVGLVEDVICFVVIDRTDGRVWELPSATAVARLRTFREFVNDEEAEAELNRVRRQSAAYGMSAMMRGFTTMVWGEVDYHFAYELRFEDEQGVSLNPVQVFSPPPFNDDTSINYRLIVDSLFQPDRKITCLELLAVYRGRVQVKATMAGNQILFEMFKRQK
jgi:hypothetical protein